MTSKTFALKPANVTRNWVIINAADAPLGRVAVTAANRLIGKHKPSYTAHVDNGDYVIIINAAHASVTGNKSTLKRYYRYSGYPSGLKEETFQQLLEKNPTRIFDAAIRGMLPKNKLLEGRLKRLKIYQGDNHGHEAQKPINIGVNS